jgi:hypothetical protein
MPAVLTWRHPSSGRPLHVHTCQDCAHTDRLPFAMVLPLDGGTRLRTQGAQGGLGDLDRQQDRATHPHDLPAAAGHQGFEELPWRKPEHGEGRLLADIRGAQRDRWARFSRALGQGAPAGALCRPNGSRNGRRWRCCLPDESSASGPVLILGRRPFPEATCEETAGGGVTGTRLTVGAPDFLGEETAFCERLAANPWAGHDGDRRRLNRPRQLLLAENRSCEDGEARRQARQRHQR